MKNQSTARDVQRTEFVEKLYNTLRKKTVAAAENYKHIVTAATSYVKDGLENGECVELLMIDYGLSRKAAEGYVDLVKNAKTIEDSTGLHEYAFQFEDANGRVWSSYDIGKTITASSNEEAWEKAEDVVHSETNLEPEKIISVNQID